MFGHSARSQGAAQATNLDDDLDELDELFAVATTGAPQSNNAAAAAQQAAANVDAKMQDSPPPPPSIPAQHGPPKYTVDNPPPPPKPEPRFTVASPPPPPPKPEPRFTVASPPPPPPKPLQARSSQSTSSATGSAEGAATAVTASATARKNWWPILRAPPAASPPPTAPLRNPGLEGGGQATVGMGGCRTPPLWCAQWPTRMRWRWWPCCKHAPSVCGRPRRLALQFSPTHHQGKRQTQCASLSPRPAPSRRWWRC